MVSLPEKIDNLVNILNDIFISKANFNVFEKNLYNRNLNFYNEQYTTIMKLLNFNSKTKKEFPSMKNMVKIEKSLNFNSGKLYQ